VQSASEFVRVLIQRINAIGVERRGPALDAMDLIALGEQEFCQLSTVLTGDAGDQGGFGCGPSCGL